MVSAEYFSTLGVPALLGRTFSADDDPAAPHAVISYDYWQRRFGRRADILGTTITIRQGVFSIIGVAPASFFGETVGQRPDVWVPLTLQPAVLPGRDWLHENAGDVGKVMWLHVFGRLKPGVRIEAAQAAANVDLSTRTGRLLRLSLRRDQKAMKQWLKLRPAATRRVADSRAVCRAPDDAPGCFRARAADCLREPGQPAAGAHDREDT